jgi:hypothetical protein
MSATTPGDFDLREQVTRIDRAIAETHRFQSETNKLQAEGVKLTQEARKFDAEHDKLRRERNLAPWLLVASVSGGIIAAGIGQILQHFWK